MPQVVVGSTTTRINGKHGRVVYYEERDIEAYYITDAELVELCRQAARQTINVAPDMLIDLIDSIDASENRRVFM